MSQSIHDIIQSSESKRQAAVERMWLSFYNNTLLEKGIITNDQHRRMKTYIATRKPSTER